MADRRVVITGTGVRACNGHDTASFIDALKHGRHGIARLEGMDQHATRFAGTVKLDNETLAGDKRTARRKDRFVLLALGCCSRSPWHVWAWT